MIIRFLDLILFPCASESPDPRTRRGPRSTTPRHVSASRLAFACVVCLVLQRISMRATSLGVKVSFGVIGVGAIFAVLKMSQLLDKAKNYVSEKVSNVPMPEATVKDVDFKRVSCDSVQYLAKVSVANPYPTPLPICEIKYSLKSAGRFVHSSFFMLLSFSSSYFRVQGLVLPSFSVNREKNDGGGWLLQDLLLLFV